MKSADMTWRTAKPRLRSVAVGLVWFALSLAIPAVAASAASTTGRFSAEFSVTGSNGYLLSVDGRPSGVKILVTEKRPRPGNFALAEYTVRGTASAEGVEADFGSLGAISVRFKPSGAVQTKTLLKTSKGCQTPHRIVRRKGTFVGTIRFEGEAGYTAVEAVEAKGSIGTPETVICIGTDPKGSDGGRHHTHPPSVPYLGVTTIGNYLGFAASALGRRGRVGFVANSRERNRKVSITRFVARKGPPSSFEFDSGLSTATVKPPPPFSGTATFQRGLNGAPPSWSGSLAVSFPGAPDVSLTGSSFTFATLEKF